MTKLYLVFSSLLFVLSANSQTTYIWKGGNGSWNTSTNWNPSGIPGNNDIVKFTNGGTQTVSDISSNYTLYKLEVSGNTNVTLEHTGGRTFTISDNHGTDFIVGQGSTLTLGDNIKIVLANNSEATIAGTLIITNKNFDTDNDGVSTTVTGIIQNDAGTINGAADKLTFASGSKYIHNRSGGAIPLATWDASSTCEITGLTSGDANKDNQAFGNLVFNCPGMTGNRNLGSTGLSIAGKLEIINIGDAVLQLPITSLDISGDFILNSGTFRIGNNTNRTINVGGSVSITGGTLLMSNGNNVNDEGVLNVAGNFSQSGGVITQDNNGNGIINFVGNSVQTFSKTGGSITNVINFNINANAIVDFGASVLNGSSGSFTIQSGGKMISTTSNPVQVSGTKTFSSSADYEFKGSSSGSYISTARNVTINNAAGNVTLSQPLTVTGDLKLQNGELITSAANLLTINDDATISMYSNTSFINGPVVKKGNDDFVFPVGRSGSGLVPIKISGLSGSSDFKAEYKRVSASSLGSSIIATGLHHVSACEYWTLERTGSATANVTLYWGPSSNCNAAAYVTELSSIVVAHFNGTSWNAYGRNGGTTGSISSGTVTWNNVSSFSPFALGSTSGINNPLPVTLTDVKAFSKNNGIEIAWSNLTEKDVADYTVERSGNGNNFAVVSTYQPKSNQGDKASYNHFDAFPLQGINYYRIKIKEISGKVTISKTLKVETAKSGKDLILYPNPVTGNQINIGMTDARPGAYKLLILNATGENVFRQTITSQGTVVTQTIQLPSSIKAGVYTLVLTGDNYRESRMVIVK